MYILHCTFYIPFIPKVTIHIAGKAQTVQADAGKTLLQISLDNNTPLEHACGGNGFCTTCLCKIKNGKENLGPRTDREEMMGITGEDERLGCQATVEGDVEVEAVEG